eukprot:GABV01001216.1.p1 GENE.GABV01001216.1~~GABV01001216.1.p1  ORF type:complete len:197 (-),score=40.17 GABV01001216.1:116-706(-)
MLVFSKVAERFGGNLKFVSTGSAPLSGKIAEWLQVVLNVRFAEGYGLSETCAATTTTGLADTAFGHVGVPLECCEVKLVSVPDMDYLTTDPEPRGEIWIRGPNVFKGYYKMPEQTAEVLTPDGWFKTGDIAKIRVDGNIAIIDRKKIFSNWHKASTFAQKSLKTCTKRPEPLPIASCMEIRCRHFWLQLLCLILNI